MPGASFEPLYAAARDAFPLLRRLPSHLFVVGGAIRDLLLGLQPLDVDLVAPGIAPVATRFAQGLGATLVELGRDPLTSYRVTSGGRVYDFTELIGSSIAEDLGRRDLTLNAIALDPTARSVVDPFGGVPDIEQRIVRIVDPKNLDDDPLRIIRAVRFSVRLAFDIDPGTFTELAARAHDVRRSAPERVTYEMNLILGAERKAVGALLLRRLGLDSVLLGGEVTDRQIAALQRAPSAGALTAWGILYADRPPRAVDDHAESWRWSENARRIVRRAIELSGEAQHAAGPGDLAVLQFDAGEEASIVAEEMLAAFQHESLAAQLRLLREREGDRLFRPQPLLSGGEIGAMTGNPPGPEIGRLKRALVEAQLRGEVRTREDAVRLLETLATES